MSIGAHTKVKEKEKKKEKMKDNLYKLEKAMAIAIGLIKRLCSTNNDDFPIDRELSKSTRHFLYRAKFVLMCC